VLVAAHVAAQVAEEVHRAALPRRAEYLGQRRLQAGKRVADRERDADQVARDERAQELTPDRLGLRLADVEADDLPATGLVDRVGDDDALARDTAAVADLLDLGVDEQIRIATLQPPLAERLHLLLQQAGDPADLALRDPQPQRFDELINTLGRHAQTYACCTTDTSACPLCLARLQDRREVAALPDLRDLQLDLARAHVPPPRPIAIAMRHAILGPPAVSRADELGHLDLRQLLRDKPHRLANHVAVLLAQHPADDLLDRHPLGTGHCRPPFVEA
jgi:hypothetical protein